MTEVMDLCSGCPAPCCYNRLVPLTDDEELRFEHIKLFGTSFLKSDKETGACMYLNTSNGNCSRWRDRPAACRTYDCRTDGY